MSPRKLRNAATIFVIAAGLTAAFLLNRRVNLALEAPVSSEQPLDFVSVPERSSLPFWGSEDIESVAVLPDALYVAGAFGVARLESRPDAPGTLERIDLSGDLPTRRASALCAWRTDLAVGLDQEGLFVRRDGSWFEMRSGFGALHVRALAESPAGELWVGAREGLFRVGFAERNLTRFHKSPVRSIAILDGGRVVSGGEKGLFMTRGGITSSMVMVGAENPWVDDVTGLNSRVFAVTPAGLFAEGDDGALRPVPSGASVGSIAVEGDRLFATTDPSEASLRRFSPTLALEVEALPFATRRLFRVGDRLMADTLGGLAERSKGGWRTLAKRMRQANFGSAHVGALSVQGGRLVVGFFDGGLAELAAVPGTSPSILEPIVAPGSSQVWAVNALLEAGGALHIASLRGAFRFDGTRVTPVEGPGAAFSLAQTKNGVAIGYGEGVFLPERKLLSGFHGLPGNQATALAAIENGLLVGTPSGLGYVEGLKVRWRVASGEGKLPHPWVTAILPLKGGVLIGTYGGGLTKRVGRLSDPGDWKPYVETEGIKVNPACLIEVKGRIYAGTDGTGLFRLSKEQTRFEPLKLSLPSQRVTSLVEKDGFLYIGTDEGLTRWPVEQDVQP